MSVDHVAVIGGGISGLATARYLRGSEHPPQVTLIEATADLGGKLRTGEVSGLPVEFGADAFITRDPEIEKLCADVGLAGDLVEPDAQKVSIWSRGALHPLPGGVVLGAPTRLKPLLGSGLVSFGGAVRAALDLVVPREVDVDHESVGELVEHRFGREVLQRLVEPLLGGIYAGDVQRLSAPDATPRLAEAARSHRSLMRGLRAQDESPPGFRSIRGGLGRLVSALADTNGVEIRTAAPVRLVERAGDGYRLTLSGPDDLEVDGLVLAVPAYVAAALLREVAPAAPPLLRAIPYASVATVTLVYEPDAGELPGSGVLVPATEDMLVKAVTFASNKWRSLMPDDRLVVRASIGRHGDEARLRLEDQQLCGAVHEDLRTMLRLSERPAAATVTRWERSMPQYEVGHRDRLERIADAVSDLPHFALVGAGYEGVGIAACVNHARRAAAGLLSG